MKKIVSIILSTMILLAMLSVVSVSAMNFLPEIEKAADSPPGISVEDISDFLPEMVVENELNYSSGIVNQNSEDFTDALNLVLAMDMESKELLAADFSVVIALEDTYAVLTSPNIILNDDNIAYGLVSMDQKNVCTLDLATVSDTVAAFAMYEPDTSWLALEPADPVEGETLLAVTVGEGSGGNLTILGAEVVYNGCEGATDELGFSRADIISSDNIDFTYFGVLINENNDVVGYINGSNAYVFNGGESSSGGATTQPTTQATTEKPNGNTDPTSSGKDGNHRGDDNGTSATTEIGNDSVAKNNFDMNDIIPIVAAVVAFAICTAVGFIIKNKKKTSMSAPVMDCGPTEPIADKAAVNNQSNVSVVKRISVKGIGGYMDGRTYNLTEEVTKVGRNPDCVIRYPEGIEGISKNHCAFVKKQGSVFVVDSSTYGTYLQNGERLIQGKEYELNDGDIIFLASEKHGFKIKKEN